MPKSEAMVNWLENDVMLPITEALMPWLDEDFMLQVHAEAKRMRLHTDTVWIVPMPSPPKCPPPPHLLHHAKPSAASCQAAACQAACRACHAA